MGDLIELSPNVFINHVGAWAHHCEARTVPCKPHALAPTQQESEDDRQQQRPN